MKRSSNVGAGVGEAPGDMIAAAQDDEGRAGDAAAHGVRGLGAGTLERQVHEVPERRRFQAQVRIVGEQRLARARARTRDHPVVGGASADQIADQPVEHLGGVRPAHGRGGRLQGIEVGNLGQARRCVGRIERHQVLDLGRGEALGRQREAQDLQVEVHGELQRHQLGHDGAVRRTPGLRLVPQEQELRRKPRLQEPQRACQEGIDAARIGLERGSGVAGQRPERALGMAVKVKRAQENVRAQGALAEDLREAALAGAALQLHLPEPVLRVHEAQRHVEVVGGLGEDMRHALAVAHHLHRHRQAGDGQRARSRWHRVAQGNIARASGNDGKAGEPRQADAKPFQDALHEGTAKTNTVVIARVQLGRAPTSPLPPAPQTPLPLPAWKSAPAGPCADRCAEPCGAGWR